MSDAPARVPLFEVPLAFLALFLGALLLGERGRPSRRRLAAALVVVAAAAVLRTLLAGFVVVKTYATCQFLVANLVLYTVALAVVWVISRGVGALLARFARAFDLQRSSPAETGRPPTAFQEKCVERLQQVLAEHGRRVDFVLHEGDVPCFSGTFTFRGRQHEIEVYADSVVMLEGESLFEAYMTAELVDDETFVEAFARRLYRYLSGGPWAGEDERGWLDGVLDALFGSRPRSGAPAHPEVPYPVTVSFPDGEQEVFEDEQHLVTALEELDSDPTLSPEGRTRVVDARGREYRLRIDRLEITWFEPLDLDARERRDDPSAPP